MWQCFRGDMPKLRVTSSKLVSMLRPNSKRLRSRANLGKSLSRVVTWNPPPILLSMVCVSLGKRFQPACPRCCAVSCSNLPFKRCTPAFQKSSATVSLDSPIRKRHLFFGFAVDWLTLTGSSADRYRHSGFICGA